MLVPAFSEIARFVADTMGQFDGVPCTALISVPAPFAPPTAFLRTQARNMAFFWDSPGGTAFAGSGAVKTIRVSGDDRLAQLRQEVDALWGDLRLYAHPECRPPAPRVFGGLAFHPGGTNPLWDQFGDGCFTLPRWCYGRRSSRAFVSLAVRGDTDCSGPRKRHLLAELENIFQALGTAEEHSALLETPRIEEPRPATLHEQVDSAQWGDHIEKIRSAIASGKFQKIVAARRCKIDLPEQVDALEVLSRLIVQPMCTRFLFGRENVSFLGASPETLFDKRGSVLQTEALAGTARCPQGAEPDAFANELLDSSKDLSEHAFVVDEIARALAPFCDELRSSKRPKVHRIREILHLRTPFKGRLNRNVDAISLLEALHPTPAVGGLPTAAAAEWIANHESDARGWYAGPVGWMDSAGDARFVVAIRCGLVSDDRAHIFTGAGIVRESRAQAEYAETALKQLPLLRALGISETSASQGVTPEPTPPSTRPSRAPLEALRVVEHA